MKRYFLEVCVDSVESAQAAWQGGANRLELCGDLLVGGVSPSPYLAKAVLELGHPVHVLLRPRFGDFLYTPAEQRILEQEVTCFRELGADGIVIGALDADGNLDTQLLSRLISAAGSMKKTLHRAFDVCRDASAALEQAIELGFDTILTSGQCATAPEGAELLAKLHAQAAGRITIMAGSGVQAGNIAQLAQKTGLTTFHMSGKHRVDSPMRYRRPGVPMGLPMANEYDRFYTDPVQIQEARRILDSLE